MSPYSFGHPRKSSNSKDMEAADCHFLVTLRDLLHLMIQGCLSQNETNNNSNKHLSSASNVWIKHCLFIISH